MAVIRWFEEPSPGGTANEQHGRDYTRVFFVVTNNAGDGAWVVGSTPGLPVLGDPYQEPSGAVDWTSRCVSIDPRRVEDSQVHWRVTCEYSSRAPRGYAPGKAGGGGDGDLPGGNPADQHPNPLLRPPEVEWNDIRVKKVARTLQLRDIVNVNGVSVGLDAPRWGPALNAAGRPYDPPVEVEVVHELLTITLNVARYNPEDTRLYRNRINSERWKWFPAYEARIRSITANSQYDNGVSFWSMKVVIEHNPDEWWLDIDNKGFEYLDNAGKLVTERDPADGGKKDVPIFLDKDGHRIADADVFKDATFMRYVEFSPIDFADIWFLRIFGTKRD